jgi:hypothetical protein
MNREEIQEYLGAALRRQERNAMALRGALLRLNGDARRGARLALVKADGGATILRRVLDRAGGDIQAR